MCWGRAAETVSLPVLLKITFMRCRAMKRNLILILAAITLASCSPKIIEHVRTETVYKDRIQRDSLYVHDSIFVSQYIKNDTVYLDKYVYKYAYKDRFVHDTTFIAKHDTTTVTKEVPAKLTKMQQWKQDSYGWLLAILFALAIWCFRKPLLALFKGFVG